MFRRVLVANRGEIALRIQRTLRRLGIESVAVYSDADRGAPHVRHADRSFRLGASESARSYLDGARVIEAARRTGAEAIHPGYGFLSENADFAESVERSGLVWIGPPPAAMRALGSKVAARELAAKAGVPVAPGSPGALKDAGEAERVADEIGYPVILKASGGGGGIGMRIVRERAQMGREFAAAQSVARSAFGDPALLMEKYLERPRHIELQVIGDRHGRLVHLGERECSIQRRHQKLVEESPSVALTAEERRSLGEMGVRLAEAAGYHSAGTLEFLYEGGRFHFNEVNARLQVEHPVTEMVYGVDLVETQVRVAAGEPLPLPSDLRPKGHAIEVRLNAEDPLRDHLPTPGLVRLWQAPAGEGIRVDAGIETGWRVPPQYDSLLAKIIAWGEDRPTALGRLGGALAKTRVLGVRTNLDLHKAILRDPAFQKGDLSTRYLEERPVLQAVRQVHEDRRRQAMALAAALSCAPAGGLGLALHRSTLPPLRQGEGR